MKIKVSLFLFFLVAIASVHADLEVGYYMQTCPQAEDIVREVVSEALTPVPFIGAGSAAGLVRLLFHDCFVGGCDGSVLLKRALNNPPLEQDSDKNIGLRGFDIIEKAKQRLESSCQGVVSCADILAFAARDATQLLNGVKFSIPSGRLDSKFSYHDEADKNLPPPEFNLNDLKDLFVSKKGLTVEDLVVLSGAHTFGRSHCSSIEDRLYPNIDPTLDKEYGNQLRWECPQNAPDNDDDVVNLDYMTPYKLDSQYYRNVRNLKALFFSDWSLLNSNETLSLVNEYADTPGDWEQDFAVSMQNLSKLNVITDPKEGEIRKICSAVNNY